MNERIQKVINILYKVRKDKSKYFRVSEYTKRIDEVYAQEIEQLQAQVDSIKPLKDCIEKLKNQNMRILQRDMDYAETLKKAREALMYMKSCEFDIDKAIELNKEALAEIERALGGQNHVEP